MRRKNLMVATIMGLSLAMLTACGGSEESKETTTKISTNESNQSNEEVTIGKETISVDKITAKQEIVDASWNSGKVQINDKIIQLPIQLSELVAMGADFKVLTSMGKELEKSYLVADGEFVMVDIFIDGEQISRTESYNDTGDFKTLEELDPIINSIEVRNKLENTVMFFPGGLTVGDSYKVIQDKLGKATEVDEDMNYKYGVKGASGYLGMTVSVDKNKHVINKIAIKKEYEINKLDSMTDIEINGVKTFGTSIVNKIELSWMSDYKELEAHWAFKENEASCLLSSIVNIEDKMYLLQFSFMMNGVERYMDVQDNEDKIYSATDENGILCNIFEKEGRYIISCLSDESFLEGSISCENIFDGTEAPREIFKNLVFDIAKSIKYEVVK